MATNGKLEARITIPTGGYDFTLWENAGAYNNSGTVPAGEYYWSSVGDGSNDLAAEFQAQLNAAAGSGTYTVTIGAGESGTGNVTISSSGVSDFQVTWDSTVLRDLCGWDGSTTIATSDTSDNHAQGLWLPDYPFQNKTGSQTGARVETNLREVESESGHYFALMGRKKRIMPIRWPMVSQNKALAEFESTANESFEQFWLDCLLGAKEWADIGGPIRFYPDADTDATYQTYYATGLKDYDPQQLIEHWTQQWVIELPRLVEVPA